MEEGEGGGAGGGRRWMERSSVMVPEIITSSTFVSI